MSFSAAVRENDPISPEESFDLGLHYFRKALVVLAADPEVQCQEMGNYNVAYELHRDVLAGLRLSEVTTDQLTDDQQKAILHMCNSLKSIEAELLRGASMPEENLSAMNDPAWIPLRSEAAKLLSILPASTYED